MANEDNVNRAACIVVIQESKGDSASVAKTNSALDSYIGVFESYGMETLRQELLGSIQVDKVVNEQHKEQNKKKNLLEQVKKLTQSLQITNNFSEYEQRVVAIVKEICRILLKYVASVGAMPDSMNLANVDEHLWPLVELLRVFVNQMAVKVNLHSEKSLLQWMPFVVSVCSFILCGQLPVVELTKSYSTSEGILRICLTIADAATPSDLFARFVAQITALCSQITSKEEWVAKHSYPKYVLQWVVVQVPFPHLGGDLLGRLLALIFPLIDDLDDSTQIVGAQMLQHVVHNTTATELRWYSDVLLEVLRVAITSRKPATLNLLLDCLVTSLDQLSPPGELGHYDRFMPRLLNDTSLCTDVTVRIVFIRHLRPIVSRMGAPHSIHVIRYLQPLLKVLIATFESINLPLLLETLQTLRTTILCAWPRIPHHSEEIFVGIFRVVAFCEVFDSDFANGNNVADMKQRKEVLLTLCEEILELLHDLNKPQPCISDMLTTVRSQCSQLVMFCDRMISKLSCTIEEV